MKRELYAEEHEAFREVCREFVAREVAPHREEWDENHNTGREIWLKAAERGLVGLSGPEEFGGAGMARDYRFRAVVLEELSRAYATSLSAGFSLQDDILIPTSASWAQPSSTHAGCPA